MKTEIVILTLGVLLLGGLALWPYFQAEQPGLVGPLSLRGESIMGQAQADALGAGAGDDLTGKHDFKPRAPRADGVRNLRWREIASYEYVIQDPDAVEEQGGKRVDQIPESVKALHGQEIALEGYMMPVVVDDEGRVKEFFLSRFVGGCCFGKTPGMHEWAECIMIPGHYAGYTTMGSVIVVGTLEVGEKFDEYGYVMSLYRIRCRKVELP